MANVLAFAEQRDGQFGSAAREAVGVASRIAEKMGGQVHALALGGGGTADAAAGLGSYGAEVVAVGEHDALAEYNPEGYVDIVVDRSFAEVDFQKLEASRSVGWADVNLRVESSRSKHGLVEHPRLVRRPHEQQRTVATAIEPLELLQNLWHNALHDRGAAASTLRHERFDFVKEDDGHVLLLGGIENAPGLPDSLRASPHVVRREQVRLQSAYSRETAESLRHQADALRSKVALARAQLGWEPRIELREGLARTIEWFRSIDVSNFRAPTPNFWAGTVGCRRAPERTRTGDEYSSQKCTEQPLTSSMEWSSYRTPNIDHHRGHGYGERNEAANEDERIPRHRQSGP